jgi:hypothetical protein
MAPPHIDYLAKDHASFKRLLRDRLASLLPAIGPDHPAELGTVILDVLSHAADQISYYQDAVATEAYLGTARQRVSVRRHARLLDYVVHEGQNARVLCTFDVAPEGPADGKTLPRGTPLLTSKDRRETTIYPFDPELTRGAQVFETMHDFVLSSSLNSISFYHPYQRVLPIGSISASLETPLRSPAVGDVLIFIETRDPETERAEDADPAHRHPVRLTRVTPRMVTARHMVLDIEWTPDDALPFELDMSCAVALGNVVLCDHGQTLTAAEPLSLAPRPLTPRPTLRLSPLTFIGQVRGSGGRLLPFDPTASIAAAFRAAPRLARPAIYLTDGDDSESVWSAQQDLLSSDRFARHFVTEVDNSDSTFLRFGDGVLGRQPDGAQPLRAHYRIGNGPIGNVGADSIRHIITPLLGILRVRNPLSAQGGTAPESLDEVRLHAPAAFRTQERALRPEDYSMIAMRHPEVRQALSTARFTGDLHTIILAVKRQGGRPVDARFVSTLSAFMEPFRRIGHVLTIVAPQLVPLDIKLTITIGPEYVRSEVEGALREAFSSSDEQGFFHPDRWSFGDPVVFSQVVRRAMQVPGVRFVRTEPSLTRLGRFGEPDELSSGAITMRGLELPRIDNSDADPKNGRIRFSLQGGL